ncbi:hypothetical protein [Nitrosospira sp. Nsp2]|uniref:hypothetical protein n=1 Tax=Nitrosospira sp. Nsp2 TaxID=136548 RepID=UPI0015E74192
MAGRSLADADTEHAFITGPDGMGMRDVGAFRRSLQLCLWHQQCRQMVRGSSISDGAIHAFITGPKWADIRWEGRKVSDMFVRFRCTSG